MSLGSGPATMDIPVSEIRHTDVRAIESNTDVRVAIFLKLVGQETASKHSKLVRNIPPSDVPPVTTATKKFVVQIRRMSTYKTHGEFKAVSDDDRSKEEAM